MSNLKIIIDNAASRAVLSAAPVAPGMSPAVILNDTKSHVCRATGKEIEIVMSWDVPERVGGAHFLCNGSPSTTIEVLGYSDAAGTTKVLDTGVRQACPARSRVLRAPWTAVSGASAYSWGGGANAFTWFDNVSVKRLVVRLKDPGSLQGYLELSHAFVGESFTPDQNASYNPGLTPVDRGEPFYTDAGDRRFVPGTKGSKLSVDLEGMTERDRSAIWDMLVANGLGVPIIISLYPGDASRERERDHQMYGALVQTAAMRRPNFARHATTLEWESM
ncbi:MULTISPECIES: hypothetical protein [unclassified Massilia]|uniref:hypothetical protein n=1 Tax=unclassified Massilia TaxID=2609279 RepID=UPI001780F6D7|nr:MULTISPECIES: hypothetical protein [unclassified Massilia]MBD8531498.1 hypothetical protein [Massilia sp. CFBP 13647]MBD8673706.1 hypothetical protein [Massilia sp. CFBP 13721]